MARKLASMVALKSVPISRRAKWVGESPEGVLALEKPAGVPSHPNRAGERAAINADYDLAEECFSLGGGRRLYLCNRLDSPTSGILVLASQKAVAKAVNVAFRERRVRKTYLAAVCGKLSQDNGTWNDQLRIRREGGKLRATARSGGVPVTTRFEVVSVLSRWAVTTTLLKLYPETGRTHQLRVQTSQRKLPILGDKTYGDFGLNRKLRSEADLRRLLLHAWKIQIDLTVDGKPLVFAASTELPEWCHYWVPDAGHPGLKG